MVLSSGPGSVSRYQGAGSRWKRWPMASAAARAGSGRAGRSLAQAQVRRGPWQAGQEQRLGLRLVEPGQLGAIAVHQPKAARTPALGIDRHARGAEVVDVAIDRADRDLELLGQGLGAGLAAGLQRH